MTKYSFFKALVIARQEVISSKNLYEITSTEKVSQ